MKMVDITPKHQLKYPSKIRTLCIILGGGNIGLSLGLSKFLNHLVFFPVFPNILDITFGCIVGSYLIWLARRN